MVRHYGGSVKDCLLKDLEFMKTNACAKHEKQLTCGAEFEGIEVTRKRIIDLQKIGNHNRIMFENECKDAEFITTVYPCIGRNVSSWIRPCSEHINAYSSVQDSVNQQISSVYDNAVRKLKASTDGKEDLRTFRQAMTSIAFLEGSKCGLFKQMRVCVLRQLLERCGVEAMKAFNTSISLGYLRTERREHLNLDFEVFNYPIHANCVGL
uniref:Transpos_assoc domain-containing protein n=1 Tax=Angiostrongylus cantonensis TaxID=6313 RepID=A0A0K0DD93_ANGCA